MVKYTSIQILPETRTMLSGLKESTRETYDDLIRKLIGLVPKGDEEGDYNDKFRFSLLNAKIDVMENRTYSLSEINKTLGLNKWHLK